MSNETETLRADVCPHCGDDDTHLIMSPVCIERAARQKAEAEVKMLNNILENTRESRDSIIELRDIIDKELTESQAEVVQLREKIAELERLHISSQNDAFNIASAALRLRD